MLTWMRKWTPIIMLVALIGFMLTIFLDWGMGLDNMPGRKGQTVGKIGKNHVGIREFSQILERRKQIIRSQGQQPQDDAALPMEVWDDYVSEIITNNTIDELKLWATDEEVYTYLITYPLPEIARSEYFQTNGQFDMNKYVDFIKTPSSYDLPEMQYVEQIVKTDRIPKYKLSKLLAGVNEPSYSQIEYEYKAQKESVTFEYIYMQPFAIGVSQEDLSDEKLLAYYNANLANFKTDEKALLYFVRFPKATTSRDEELTYEALAEIRENILSENTTFAEEAAVESDDPGSAKKGGELGWFGKGRMVKEFEDVAFSTPSGEISYPFKSNYGYHIIAVDSVKTEDGEVVEVKAKHILKNIVPSAETLDSIEAFAENVRQDAEGKTLSDIAKSFSVQIDSTPPFGRGENPSKIGYVADLGNFVFDKETKVGDVGKLFETEGEFFVVQLKEKIAKGMLPFEHAKAKIKDKVSDSLRVRGAKDYLNEVKNKIGGISFEEFVETDDKLIAGVADSVTRKQYIPNVGVNNEIVASAFTIPENTVSSPIIGDNGAYLVRTIRKYIVREMPEGAPEFSSIRDQIRREDMDNIYTDWFNANKKRLKITENVREFYY